MLKWPFGAGNKTAASAQSADQLVLEGNRAEKEGRLREACDLYRKAVAAAPNHGKARLNLGIALQAVECRLPIVTREGRFMRGRLASGILKRMGLPELVTRVEKDYVALAVKLAQVAEYRRDVRNRIAKSSHVLYGDLVPIRALEGFLIEQAGNS